MSSVASLLPRLYPRTCNVNHTKIGGEESGEFYHVKDVIGRENLIASSSAV